MEEKVESGESETSRRHTGLGASQVPSDLLSVLLALPFRLVQVLSNAGILEIVIVAAGCAVVAKADVGQSGPKGVCVCV